MKDINLFETKDSIHLKKISSKKDIKDTDSIDGYFIVSSESETRRIIDSLKSTSKQKIIAFQGGDNHTNRRALETLKIDYLVSLETGLKKDSLKQRDSGLNHVLAEIASQKNIPIVINFSELKLLKGMDRVRRISRVMQNIKIGRKANCKIKIANLSTKGKLASETTRKSFGRSLGMSTGQARDCVSFD